MKQRLEFALNGAWSAVLVACALAMSGCGGGEETAEGTPAAPAAEAGTEAAATEETAEAPAEESTTEALVVSAEPVDVEESLKTSDQALKAKDWTKATDALLRLQLSGSIQTDQQSWNYNRKMTVLQDQLLEAAENGDARAKAAVELLRKSRRVR